MIKQLTKSDLFQGYNCEQISGLLDKFKYRVKKLKDKDIFALQGDLCQEVNIILSGVLDARMTGPSGKEIQIDRLETGRIIAPALIFATDNKFPVTVYAEGDTHILIFSLEEFTHLMQQEEIILANFIRNISDINSFLSKKIKFLSLRTIKGKIADYLFTLSDQNANLMNYEIQIKEKWQTVADKFGINRQSLARGLAELEEEGYIEVHGKIIRIKNKPGLRLVE